MAIEYLVQSKIIGISYYFCCSHSRLEFCFSRKIREKTSFRILPQEDQKKKENNIAKIIKACDSFLSFYFIISNQIKNNALIISKSLRTVKCWDKILRIYKRKSTELFLVFFFSLSSIFPVQKPI